MSTKQKQELFDRQKKIRDEIGGDNEGPRQQTYQDMEDKLMGNKKKNQNFQNKNKNFKSHKNFKKNKH